MANVQYDKQLTALLVIDPCNDFISEGDKVWDRLKAVAEANDCVPHMPQVLNAARKVGLRVFYAPHRRYRPGDYETWKYIAPIQKAAWSRKTFEYATFGGEFRSKFSPQAGEIVALEQRLRQHRFGFAPQEAWDPTAHRHRPHSSYLCRGDRTLRR
jgi:nicotinamidase-related amidase